MYAAASEDMDTLTFRTPILLRHLTFSEQRKIPISEIDLEKVLTGLDMSYEEVPPSIPASLVNVTSSRSLQTLPSSHPSRWCTLLFVSSDGCFPFYLQDDKPVPISTTPSSLPHLLTLTSHIHIYLPPAPSSSTSASSSAATTATPSKASARKPPSAS